ncbi:hypothetical protein N7474_010113 [Penicillium riverlandense]|uniref:uncharacterized protein n=1 Tax=Penicillium riverlandense TaxID=1903569 RepID=UPI00254674C9|nr:uncharacterized protein N7474_010113 [Penicillium riverlandense]KAJ5808844.1 hypothetical protein N7474_010113 [Penicillium riverlandense]
MTHQVTVLYAAILTMYVHVSLRDISIIIILFEILSQFFLVLLILGLGFFWSSAFHLVAQHRLHSICTDGHNVVVIGSCK